MSLLSSLRKKPKEVKSLIAFSVALGVSAVVAGTWSLSLPSRLSVAEESLSAISNVAKEQAATVGSTIDVVKEALSTTTTSSSTITVSESKRFGGEVSSEEIETIIEFSETLLITGEETTIQGEYSSATPQY